MLTVERIATLEGLEALAPAWGALLARDPHGHPFVSPEWTRAWWRHFGAGAALWLLAVKDGPEVVGIAPMMLRRERFRRLPMRTLSFMSNRHVSRADVIAPERRAEVVAALARYWRAQAWRWDVLELRDIPRPSPTAALLGRALEQAGLKWFDEPSSPEICYLDIDGTLDQYAQRQSRKFRKNIANARNRLARAGDVRVIVEREPARMRAALERLFRLDEKSRKQEQEAALLDPNEKTFTAAVAQAFAGSHGCDVRMLFVNDEPTGGLYSLVFGRAVYLILTYFGEDHAYLNPGRNLIWGLISDYWDKERFDRIDFNGDSQFVKTWTTDAHGLRSITAFSPHPYAKLLATLKTAGRRWRGAHGDAGSPERQDAKAQQAFG